jgi:hypothetical protein
MMRQSWPTSEATSEAMSRVRRMPGRRGGGLKTSKASLNTDTIALLVAID